MKLPIWSLLKNTVSVLSHTDWSGSIQLSIALKKFNEQQSDKSYVFELPVGSIFRIYNGKLFRKGNRRTKRYECVEVNSGKVYLFQPNAEVELINT